MKYLKMLAVAAALAGVANLAHATLSVSLNDGSGAQTCNDGAACDAAGAAGVVSFTGAFGTITVAGIGSGAPALPTGNLDITWNVTAPSGSPAHTYTIMVSQDGLNFPAAQNQWTGLAGGTQTNGATTAWDNWAGFSLFQLIQQVCNAGSTTANPVALSCSGPTFGPSNGLISLTSVITITALAGATSATGDALLTLTSRTVPEPASLALLGIGLAGLGFAVRRKQA